MKLRSVKTVNLRKDDIIVYKREEEGDLDHSWYGTHVPDVYVQTDDVSIKILTSDDNKVFGCWFCRYFIHFYIGEHSVAL